MDTVLFNFHDLILILTGFECLLFALLLVVTRKDQPKSSMFFVGFLLCHTFIPLHELTFWGKQFRLWMLDISPNVFFTGSYAYFIDGPLLYFFVRSLLFKDFHLKKSHLLHAIPLALYFLHMLISFYFLDLPTRTQLVESQHIAYSAPYLYFDAAGRFIRVGYGVFCLILIMNYSEQLKHYYANVNKQDLSWLKMMILSFLLLFSWDAMLLSVKLYGLFTDNFNLDLLNVLGLSAYYLTFCVLNVLIFLKFTRLGKVSKVNEHKKIIGHELHDKDIDERDIQKIEEMMVQTQVYTDSDINFDKLTASLETSTRKFSKILKHHYQMNFYEFINTYRTEEAKKLLRDPAKKHLTITDIYCEVGFNSKSVFNTFFKSKVGMTPSEYRVHQLETAKRKKIISMVDTDPSP